MVSLIFYVLIKKKPFRLWDHLRRFEASAKELDLPLPLSLNEVVSVIDQLLEKAPYPEANIKIFLTGGQSSDQYMPEGRPTFFALVYPVQPFPEKMYLEGVSLGTKVYERPYPTCKSIHYLTSIMAVRKVQKQGAHDVLFLNHQREILEVSTANFFGIKGNRVVTSKEGIIAGVTRQVVLELLEERGVTAEIRAVPYEEIQTFDGAFITSSSKGIVPVVQIDEMTLLQHPLIETLSKDFRMYTQNFSTSEQMVSS